VAHGLHGLQGFFFSAQGLHGLHGFFLAAHGLQGLLTFFTAHGLHGLHGFFLAAHGLQAVVAARISGFCTAAGLTASAITTLEVDTANTLPMMAA
jgi:hypothetical protein